MLNSTATKVVVSNRNGKKVVTGVEFVFNKATHRVNVRKEAVLSAGAINSPQILLLSGIGPKSELDRVSVRQVHELPGVGRNLHNHATFYLTFLLRKQRATNDLDWATALDYILYRTGPMSSTGMSQLTARINSKYADPSGSFPDLQIFFAGYLAHCAKSGEINAPLDSSNPDLPKELTISPVVLHPKSRGYLTLKSKNPLEPPQMYANYLTEPEDVSTLIEGIRVTQRLANTTVLKNKYGIELMKEEYGDCNKNHKFDSDEYWECAVRHSTGPENHQAGSCKMGPSSDRLAVVNPKLQVYGIDGLRVMDASVMPAVVSGNTHATVVMIAERGVDFIKERWSAPRSNVLERSGFAGASATRSDSSRPTRKQSDTSTFKGQNTGAYYPEYHNYPHGSSGHDYYNHDSFPHDRSFHENHPNYPNPFDNSDYGYGNYYHSDYNSHDYHTTHRSMNVKS